MQGERSEEEQQKTSKGERSDDDVDRAVLQLLLDDGSPWTVDEIVRETSDRLDAGDAVTRLVAAGLAHRMGEFVVPSRAARRVDKIGLG